MQGTNWEQIRAIFDDALQRPPEERNDFLNEICGDDADMFDEVSSLLSSFQSADSFMEAPAVTRVADIIAADLKDLKKGTCFGHYEIVRQIGIGGMGAVYLAKDKKLDREVAIKILDEKLRSHDSNPHRFTQEAKAASALNHPNILVIHEIGESEDGNYIVSEYIKGKTLRDIFKDGSLKLSEILNISIQIANALCAAHEARIIHRDVKPENIMIRPDGFAKILDFGLAKLVEGKGNSIFTLRDTDQNQTAKGIILGTVNYMSPEQAKGERVDERSDIFSFGALIYEMVAGHTPFAGDTNAGTFANIINSEPRDLAPHAANIPDEFATIVMKMLRKDKKERYQTMKDVLADLKSIKENPAFDEKLEYSYPLGSNKTKVLQGTTGGAHTRTGEIFKSFSRSIKQHKPLTAAALVGLLASVIVLVFYFYGAGNAAVGSRKSIAVLPLKPIDAENRDAIYEIGIADSLINRLGLIKDFIVRPLSATRKYADIEQDAIAAGREQQVDYVLATNYQIVEGKVRITAQIFNVATGQIEETYKSEKETSNIFATQDAIAGEIGNILLARFSATKSGPLAKRGTTNEEAYRLYIQGMILHDQRKHGKAIETFEKAVAIDPNYALAWAGLAHAHLAASGARTYFDNNEELQKTKEAFTKALELDPNLSEAYTAKCVYEGGFAESESACQRALELDPNSPVVHRIYSGYLTGRGRHDEAIAEIKTAIDLDPTSYANQRSYANQLYFARRYDEAVAQYKRMIEMDEKAHPSYEWLIRTLEAQGNESEAFEWFLKLLTLRKTDNETIKRFNTAYQRAGWRGVLLERERTSDGNDFRLAGYNARLGNKDKAFEYLERSYQQHLLMGTLQVEPQFDPLRDDPRFDELLRRVGFK